MKNIAGSIVLYKNDPVILIQAINSFLSTDLDIHLYLVDNSPTDELRYLLTDSRVTYIFNNKNIGFGAAHNIAIKEALKTARYHLVLNPDVYFNKGTLEFLYHYLESHPEVGQVMPKVLYPDGSLQYLCKLLPTPYDLILRRFLKGKEHQLNANNERYELRFSGYDKVMEVPYLSGCFMLFRTAALQEVGLFDERIFMYIEDADLTRRMHQKFKTVYHPGATIYHHFAKGSHKNKKLLFYAIHGAFIYFNKWGWFFDKERTKVNNYILNNLLK
jgi:GT2 family glycosyltransferase